MKSLVSMLAGLLVLIGCGSEKTPEQQAKDSADFVKEATSGKVSPVVKDVGSMANSTQDDL